MRLTGSVKVDLGKLKAVREANKPDGDQMTRWKKRSARRYRSFLQKRFDRFSRGGGNWKKTARVLSGAAQFILRKTHTLFRALSPIYRGLPGQFERITKNTIQTGYGGQARHPNSKITVAKLARVHNNGLGIVSQRQIVVRPSSEVVRDITADLDRTVKRGQ